MIGLKTLVLNKNYMPISVFPLSTIPAEDAVVRVVNGTCNVLMEYDRRILTQKADMFWPSIVVRTDNVPVENIVKLKRESIYYRDHGKCQYCGDQLELRTTTYDHVHPASLGGKFSWDNIVAACFACNTQKGNRLPVGEWKPRNMPYKPTYWQLLKARRKFPLVIGDESWKGFIGPWDAEIKVVT